MRSKYDNTFAGAGTLWAYDEEKENNKELYRSHYIEVELPYDYMNTDTRKNLNGPVKTYHISELEDDKNVRKTTHSKRRK